MFDHLQEGIYVIHGKYVQSRQETHPTWAQREKAHLPGKSGPNHVEKKSPKPEANMLQIAPNFAGAAHIVLEAYIMKIGLGRHL
jgi:hypothetical protein